MVSVTGWAQLDDPELLLTLEGGMDDPDGIDGVRPLRRDEIDEGWDLDDPLSADEDDARESESTSG